MWIIKKLIEIGKRRRNKGVYPPGTKLCAACKDVITKEQGRTKQMGLHFHRSCWKLEKKGN